MITLGLTGNRYSGKSTVVNEFKRIGIPVFDADLILRFILNYNYELLGSIKRELGDDLFLPHSKNELILDFRHMDKVNFDKVIDFIEPDIFKSYARFNSKIKNAGGIYTIFNSSILFERNWNTKLDMVINVFSSDSDRLKRCKSKTNLGLFTIKEQIATELPGLEKNKEADYIIYNHNVDFGGSAVSSSLLKQVNKIDQQIIDEFIYKEGLYKT